MVRMKSFYVIMLIMTAMTVFSTWAVNEEVAYNKEEAQKTEQSLNAIQQGVGENQEIEDIMDAQEIEDAFNREFRYEDDFIYNSDDSNSIIKQIETFCETNNYILCEGWKVLVARRYIQKNRKPSEELIKQWEKLFDKIK